MKTRKFKRAEEFLRKTGISVEESLALSDAEILKLLK